MLQVHSYCDPTTQLGDYKSKHILSLLIYFHFYLD